MKKSDNERRRFLRDIGSGMLVAGLGSSLASNLGLAESETLGGDDSSPIKFGRWEPLVRTMEETPVERLLPMVVEKLNSGTTLKQMIAAASLANARACGGEDFDAFHAMMALAPAFEMTAELPDKQKALPVLKVLHRNSRFIQKYAADHTARLCEVGPADKSAGAKPLQQLKDAIQNGNMELAEQIYARNRSAEFDVSYNGLLQATENDSNIHRIVLTHRSWELKDLVGEELSKTLLRQSVRFSASHDKRRLAGGGGPRPLSLLLPRLLDEYRLMSKPLGQRKGDDAWVISLCKAIRDAEDQSSAAEAVAAALSEGYSPEHIGEAISLAANERVLRDPGRRKALKGKPVGSVHGGSEGVHACDGTNAWRNIARVSNQRNAVASLIVAGYYVGSDDFYLAEDGPMNDKPFPLAENLDAVDGTTPKELLVELDEAVRAGDQLRACAVAHRYSELGGAARPVFDVLLHSAVRSDGALHAEKFYRTATEEFKATRASFRWRHIVALARVSASQYGIVAPGYEEARELLRLF